MRKKVRIADFDGTVIDAFKEAESYTGAFTEELSRRTGVGVK